MPVDAVFVFDADIYHQTQVGPLPWWASNALAMP